MAKKPTRAFLPILPIFDPNGPLLCGGTPREKVLLAVDPGLEGAIVAVDYKTGALLGVSDYLHSGDPGTDWVWCRDTLGWCKNAYEVVGMTIEEPLFFTQIKASSLGVIGMNWGVWVGIALAYNIPVVKVTAAEWAKAMVPDRARPAIPAGLDAQETRRLKLAAKRLKKTENRVRAQEVYPAQAALFATPEDDGRADAALLGRYAQERWKHKYG